MDIRRVRSAWSSQMGRGVGLGRAGVNNRPGQAEWHGPAHAAHGPTSDWRPGPSRPTQKFPAHPGKQIFFAPGRAGSEYPVVAITGPCSTKVVLFVNLFCHAAMIVQMQKKKSSTRSKAAQTCGFSFCPTVRLPIWSTVWYFNFEYLHNREWKQQKGEKSGALFV